MSDLLLSRRSAMLGLAAAGLGAGAPASGRVRIIDSLSGDHLYSLVREFDGLGEHRTGSRGDQATSRWMTAYLRRAGFRVEYQDFTIPFFDPLRSEVVIDGAAPIRDAFPLWPPTPTPIEGISALLVSTDSGRSARNAILLADLPYTRGGSIEARAMRRAIDAAVAAGALGIIGVTEGPTGTVIAQNVPIATASWGVPILLVGSAALPRLRAAATTGQAVRLISTGQQQASAPATNVIARRRGRGETIVLSTPKSGWFHVAGERGGGIALWLGLAAFAARHSDADLLWVSTSGHELGNHGGHLFQDQRAPPPEKVRLWLHIGANVASNPVRMLPTGSVLRLDGTSRERGLLASEAVIAATRRGFRGQPGYENPVPRDTPNAVGEVTVFRDAGYEPLVGLVGGHPLHHTRLDRAEVVTSPQALAPVAQGLATILRAVV